MTKLLAITFFCLFGSIVQAQRPNILCVIADDMSHTSAYGYKFVNTPHFVLWG